MNYKRFKMNGSFENDGNENKNLKDDAAISPAQEDDAAISPAQEQENTSNIFTPAKTPPAECCEKPFRKVECEIVNPSEILDFNGYPEKLEICRRKKVRLPHLKAVFPALFFIVFTVSLCVVFHAKINSSPKKDNFIYDCLKVLYYVDGKDRTDAVYSSLLKACGFSFSENVFDASQNDKIPPEIVQVAEKPEEKSEDAQLPQIPGSKDLSKGTDKIFLSNQTSYKVDPYDILSMDYPISGGQTQLADVPAFSEDTPCVLIIHTHGTECYTDYDETGTYAQSSVYRSSDTEKNVVHIGDILTDTLKSKGVGVIHCREMFDEYSYIKSYKNSYAAVYEYLSEYPSIKYVIDLHRDSVTDGNGNQMKCLADINGEKYAQLMLVVGTDEAGADHKFWKDNLRVAEEIQNNIISSYPSLMRPINLRKASFNQQLSKGYFILETGCAANSLDEAERAVTIFGEIFSDTIKSKE